MPAKEETKKIGSITVTVEKRGNLIHFSTGGQGRAIWNIKDSEWVTIKGEVGWRFKGAIKNTFPELFEEEKTT